MCRFFPTRSARVYWADICLEFHACVTCQQSCKSLSHSNYLLLLPEGRPLFPHRRDRPANPLVFAKGTIHPHYSIFLHFL